MTNGICRHAHDARRQQITAEPLSSQHALCAILLSLGWSAASRAPEEQALGTAKLKAWYVVFVCGEVAMLGVMHVQAI